jgi:glycosyltransferase involved in cell wall biosynthesis
MKIVLIGTRGLPAAYSGFETAVENIGARLAARGHRVSVYCRPHMVEGRHPVYRGMELVYLPTVASKHLDTIVHTLVCTLHMAVRRRPDAAVYFIAGNSPMALLSRLLGVPAAINVDGLDSRRAKWNPLARRYLRWAERNAPRFADATITDSREVQRIYREEYGYRTHYIPYGSELDDDGVSGDHGSRAGGNGRGSGRPALEHLERLGLEPRDYVLFVGRLVPENNAHVLVEAFAGLDTGMKLAVVGDAPYAEDYQRSLRAAADARVVFTGYEFGAAYRELVRNAAICVVPTEVGGTHPVLLEAMAAGNCVVVNDHPPNVEVIGDAGAAYPAAEGAAGLRRVLAELLGDPDRIERLRGAAAERARALYSWEAVTDAYEALARAVAHGKAGR